MRQVSVEDPIELNGDINKRFCSNELTEAKSNIETCDDSNDGRCNQPVSKTENRDLQFRDDTDQNEPMVSNLKFSVLNFISIYYEILLFCNLFYYLFLEIVSSFAAVRRTE